MKNTYSSKDVNMVRSLDLCTARPSAKLKLDEANMHYKTYVDIKSEPLRDILREVLCDVNTVSLRGDKPEVRLSPCVVQDL